MQSKLLRYKFKKLTAKALRRKENIEFSDKKTSYYFTGELPKPRFALLYSNKITMGINPTFNCCGKKNQVSKRTASNIAVAAKYFFTQTFLLNRKKAMKKLVGSAHNKFKLFLHMLWSVPTHIKISRIPNSPVAKKSRP